MSDTATLAFEIGTEEIPAFDLKRATEQLAELVPAALDAVRIPHGEVAIYTSPRRLIAIVADVAARTEALEEVFRGPAAKIAFDEAGNPTKAAIGFARGKGLDVDALERRDENGTEYVYAVRQVPSQDVAALLPEVLRGVIDGISWPKSCRWGTTTEMFSRPVRWLVALLGNTVIPVEYAGLVADRETRGHRFLAPGPHTVASADDLVSVVEGAFVVPTQEAREAVIRKGVAAIEAATGFTADLPAKTLTEVINLSEYPTPMVGTFDEEFLKVPEEIIVDAMLMHQRYFPLYDADGKLTNKFIIVSNGDPAHEDTIVDGNERVVAARLYDAKFFYDEDLKMPLDAYVDRLDEVVFQEALGTMRDKTARVVKLSARITSAAGIEAAEMRDIARSALPGQGRPGDERRHRVHERPGHHGQLLRHRRRRGASRGPRHRRALSPALLRRRHPHRHHRPGGGALRQDRHHLRPVRRGSGAHRLLRSLRPAPRRPGRAGHPGGDGPADQPGGDHRRLAHHLPRGRASSSTTPRCAARSSTSSSLARRWPCAMSA